ncbi:3-hydroxybutyryl-CoA dehydrogenase [Spongiactinospora gelatinilytica]|uniref:3-hydroxybutyryl-CoA dehydrogenase n=1 Tax=Spongiactinospora gelatinilytica TaxID=2666298 RepID=A0A2W2HB78_9ACTN|nr:3-hydroxyacyl-CoA dehydrogenase NAD-binding domain-containing protein [Spongiactinospora gelatinilytica]PZG47440.1 3-hydroxybutyryl-CoA dehydrogenase [Spongiactinospora gelatinilytica]
MPDNDSGIRTIGVIGAGVMGSEVAQVFAQSGFDVVLVDVTDQALDRARQTIERNLRFQRMLGAQRGLAAPPTVDRAAVLARIRFTTRLADAADADFVVENVTEDWNLKRPVFEELDEVCKPDVVFAVNTSCIPITRVGGVTNRPSKIIGAHFMNPVSLKPMVEVIRGFHTSDETVRTMLDLLAAIGKEGVVVADSPGFVSNRVLMLTVNEAAYLVHERVADATEVDRIFKGCFGHTMGPLETADLIGLDTILLSIEGLYQAFGDSKYRPCPLLKQLVDAGLHGRKSGRGFHVYQ